MVDDAPRPELGDRQEPGPGQELVSRLPRPPRRDERRERKPGEVVARQEALAGEVAVAVEVGLDDVARLGQQVDLRFGLAAQPLGLRSCRRLPGGVADDWFWASRWATAARNRPRQRSQAASKL